MVTHTIEVIRSGDRSVGDDLGLMIAWCSKAGVQLHQLLLMHARHGDTRYRAGFDDPETARRFFDAFDERGTPAKPAIGFM